MFAITRNRIVLLIVVLLIILPAGQLFAQGNGPDCAVKVPQWAIDRQQYETTFVYVPAVEMVDAAGMDDIPQWVLDRQQYETTFVHVPTVEMVDAAGMDDIPQWVLDRQQYETAFVYVLPAEPFALAYNECAVAQAGDS